MSLFRGAADFFLVREVEPAVSWVDLSAENAESKIKSELCRVETARNVYIDVLIVFGDVIDSSLQYIPQANACLDRHENHDDNRQERAEIRVVGMLAFVGQADTRPKDIHFP